MMKSWAWAWAFNDLKGSHRSVRCSALVDTLNRRNQNRNHDQIRPKNMSYVVCNMLVDDHIHILHLFVMVITLMYATKIHLIHMQVLENAECQML